MIRPAPALFLAAALAAAAPQAVAEKRTVCTVTINSADERDVMRRQLPADRYEFVELVERGKPDWMRAACERNVRCDVLVVSGHFAGTEFYASKPEKTETLPVPALEREICTQSCPGVFDQLKEVYLFGCDTLKAEPVRSAMPEVVRNLIAEGMAAPEAERVARAASERYGESSRLLMRGLFAHVPVIYGFSSLAPLGVVAGPMLERHLASGPDAEIGSGQVSQRLLSLFGPSSMVVTSGIAPDEPYARHRQQACRAYDARVGPGRKVADMHALLAAGMLDLRMSFDRVEAFFANATKAERAHPEFAAALAALAADREGRERYLGIVRRTQDPALRVRMVALGRTVGWLSASEQRTELARTIGDLLVADAVGFGEVDLVCRLNETGELNDALAGLTKSAARRRRISQSAALACLGSAEDRQRVLHALASQDEEEVRVVQAYLRHRPIADTAEFRKVALGVAKMRPSPAQARALEALARLRLADGEVYDAFTTLFTRTPSLEVQRAIAEVFLRAEVKALPAEKLARLIRQHRRRAPPGAPDPIDALLGRLQTGL